MSEAAGLLEAVWAAWPQLRRPIERAALGVDVYLVGGYVRDLLLGAEPGDLDLTVEGDGPAYAERLARAVSGTVRLARRFQTAAVELPNGQRIDVTTARSEEYETPGALPRIVPSSLAKDLERRDFTVNTFALGLAGGAVGKLLASEQGRADLRDRTLRVLHDRSFSDDPTRVLRAVRLEVARGFRLEPASTTLARRALSAGVLDAVSGARLWRDLRPLLEDGATVSDCCRRLDELGLFGALSDGLGWSSRQEGLLAMALRELEHLHDAGEVTGVTDGIVTIALLALATGEGAYVGEALAKRLGLSRAQRESLSGWPGRVLEARRRFDAPDLVPSVVHAALERLSLAELAFLQSSLGQATGDWIRREALEFRQLELTADARDLLAAGQAPGPAIGRALALTRAARLDGVIGPEQEFDYALGVLGRAVADSGAGDESE